MKKPLGAELRYSTLQHIHADLPTPTSSNITTVASADDTTILSTYTNLHIAQQQVQPYLQQNIQLDQTKPTDP